jgi:hypothetical protein
VIIAIDFNQRFYLKLLNDIIIIHLLATIDRILTHAMTNGYELMDHVVGKFDDV